MSSDSPRDPQRQRDTLAEPDSGSEGGMDTEEEEEAKTRRLADWGPRGVKGWGDRHRFSQREGAPGTPSHCPMERGGERATETGRKRERVRDDGDIWGEAEGHQDPGRVTAWPQAQAETHREIEARNPGTGTGSQDPWDRDRARADTVTQAQREVKT